ncbi:uncharacterized protein SPPG_00610 [Spizellomyces punctatus DAOM BR117]|uniref:Uncharacterized protein n=1 Tax=Spizellomyces punctatus (strain DAOM BR117) TaxID=645134 RepID=A0A0L0HVK7_SPIPD|nr:uncharacterized protein SPPG_00610 [Spizellomyces punctatus DAOM BR117]KND04919.1 hypothetical protein SPPG_00610 [Spizellomyces punctatus DAOM BR117]|eukprot:XP_016612958.1 hypothetical protein SPPG_00610 [Spizellomyces punctatus DAOM BR117]
MPPTLLDLLSTTLEISSSKPRPRTPILHYLLTRYLPPPDILRVLQTTDVLHSERRHCPSGELWWTLAILTDTGHPPNRGMRPVERRRDWKRVCFQRYKDDMARRDRPVPVMSSTAKDAYVSEIMEASYTPRARGKLTAEEKQEARAWYKDLRNKKVRGKGPEKDPREFFTV